MSEGHFLLMSRSNTFLEVIETAKKVRGRDAGILITGESGSGKEVLARYIHGLENDPKRPFVAINCGAIPDNLIESELFGHEKGSFTGATERKIGHFEKANGGDIFLDEIGTLKPELQTKLLRVLEEKEIWRVGGTEPIKLDFRILAATNEDLLSLSSQKKFRSDLYYRLAVVQFHLPPLRERIEDVEPLANHFLATFCKDLTEIKRFAPEVLEAFKNYEWPGNIRELKNSVYSAVVMSSSEIIDLDGFHRAPFNVDKRDYHFKDHDGLDNSPYPLSLRESLLHYERCYIKDALKKSRGNKTAAAKNLGMARSRIYERIDSLSIDLEPDDTLD